MKKTRPETEDPADHEVDFRGGVRGKYLERYRGRVHHRAHRAGCRAGVPRRGGSQCYLRKVIRESRKGTPQKAR
jgi:hypothetical protein